MKKRLLVVILVLIATSTIAQKKDTLCSLKVEQSLDVIKQYLENKNADSALRRVAAIHFLSLLSGIPSESNGNYIGQLTPTLKDYTKWQKWYQKNKYRVSCDKIKSF